MAGKRKLPDRERKVYETTSELAARTGLSIRYFQNLAKRVPFASQPESGGAILFDIDAFERWIAAGRPKAEPRPKTKPLRLPQRRPPTASVLDPTKPLVEALREMRANLKRKK
ncbi:hypothetical protein RLW55_03185 [Hyphomicrobium sp. B1]|uniref:hypothetical protein n=1 Tax=Hyphomicrobium sp. B1 TaxID=3075651 RepID=UPI003C2D5F4E